MAPNEIQRLTTSARTRALRGIYVIVDQDAGREPVALAGAALRAGVRIVQYRAKHGLVPSVARELRDMTRRSEALFIVNDDPNAALAYDADGVHLGPGDPGFEDAHAVRRLLGDRIIGLSCGTVEEVRAANESGADYLGVGPVFATASKADAGSPLGLAGLARIARAGALPIAAIGGIGVSEIASVRETGVAMVALISALAGASDPYAAAGDLLRSWNGQEFGGEATA